MVEMYCSDHHSGEDLCVECSELVDYADRKLDLCPYGPDKPTCTNCPIHCYRPEPRERMREIMRYSGPRMLKNHPYLAIRHIFDGKREAQPLPKKADSG
jgi:hypothetical protein